MNHSEMAHQRAILRNKAMALSREELDQLRQSITWDEFFGSTLDLGTSILNLLDKKISSEDGDHDSSSHQIDDLSATTAPKTQSLPVKASRTSVELRNGRLPSQCLPSERPVSLMETDSVLTTTDGAQTDNYKKRPLSISSMSSASTSSLPRLRKKRANSDNTAADSEGSRDGSQSSDVTLVPSRGSADRSTGSESRHSVDSGCVDSDRNGEKDNMSITSSETGSFRDEVDSSSIRDVCVMSCSPSDKPQLEGMSQSPSKSNFTTHRSAHSPEAKARTSRTWAPNPKSSTPRRRTQNADSADYHNDSGTTSDKSSSYNPPSPTIKLPDSEVQLRHNELSRSPENHRRSSSSSSRYEARRRFFDNYEEHMSQSPTSASPLDDDYGPLTPNSKRNGVYVNSTDLMLSPVTLDDSPDRHSRLVRSSESVLYDHASASSPTATTTTTTEATAGRRRDSPSQLSPNSQKTSRRSERRGSSSKHDGQTNSSTSQRSVFSRTSRKSQAAVEPGSRSGPVYVSYVHRVVTEIIESERTYIASLKDIIEGYLEPLEKTLTETDQKEDIDCLFSNIRDIYSFGCTFLADLENTGADPVKVAQCFVRHNKGFVIYTDYCTNYPRAVEVLTRFMQDPVLSELCKERQLALGHPLPLGAFLLKPVQRILKYHLLLQNIVKNSEKDGKDASILEQAFHHMTRMAHHINEMKRRHEHAVRIQEIQSLLEDYVGEDLTRLGELVLESTFRVYGAKASRQVFLFERGLLISKKNEGGMLSCKTFIRCSNLMLVEVIPNEPLSFHVIPFDNPRAQFTLQARNMEQKRRWCQEIKRLILESFKGRIPENVKSLIMQLGREHDDDYVPKEALEAVRKSQHTAPEYLEKRRVRRKSGSRMPDFSLLKPQRAKRGGNKKNDNKPGEKLSPETGRRAASRSPDGHRRIFSRQNNLAKRRSQSSSTSLPTTPISDVPEPFSQSGSRRNRTISQPTLPDQVVTTATSTHTTPPSSSSKHASPSSTTPSPRKSPRRKLLESSKSVDSFSPENDTEVMKRPVSFLMARARPINSEDLSQLMVRCGGSIKMQSSQRTLQDDRKDKACHMPADLQDISGYSLRSRSDMDDSSDDDDHDTILGDEQHEEEVNDKSEEMVIDNPEDSRSTADVPTLFDTETTAAKNLFDFKPPVPKRAESRSASLPVLNTTDEEGGEHEGNDSVTEINKDKIMSQSSENVLENSKVPKPRGRMSRRDMQNVVYTNGHYVRQKGKGANSSENIESEKGERRVVALHDTYGNKRTAEKVVLRKKGLRMPNTSKHLSVQDYQSSSSHPSGQRAKLTNWNSVDKLTKGSLNDLSHLKEDPWVMNPEAPKSDTETESSSSHKPKAHVSGSPPAGSSSLEAPETRPRGHSDVSDMMQVATNKENLDWIVYLNRNSLAPGDRSPVPSKRMSTSALNKHSVSKESLDSARQLSSQHPYATPPRSYMTTENMRRLGSKDSSVNAFGSPSKTVTLTKPMSFNSNNLPRCNSTPLSSQGEGAAKAASRGRPVSMDIDKLTDESNRMVAEMEEYISKTSSAESIKSPNKFPTSLPTITVEEEEADSNNRLSIASSLSTSSYDSQGSSSSEGIGLVGTLKHKLHSWSQHAGIRNDSEHSYASTLTSDDEDKEDTPYTNSGNTFEPPSRDRTSWREERQLETVLREHGLGSSSLGSRMAHSVVVDPSTPHHSPDFSAHNTRPHSTCGLSVLTKTSGTSNEVIILKENSPDQARYSLPPTTEATEALMPPSLRNLDIQQSDSGFSLQSNDSSMSDQTQSASDTVPEPAVEISVETSKCTTPETETRAEKAKPLKETEKAQPLSVNKTHKSHGSNESVGSADSFYERKLSVAFDSEVFDDNVVTKNVYSDPQPQEEVEVPVPRKSIREFVQELEQKCRPPSPKIFEVKRREPGAMIKARLETLQESATNRWRSSSRSSSRPVSEERDYMRSKSQPPTQPQQRWTYGGKKGIMCSDDIRVSTLKTSSSRDSLSKSMDNLSSPRESLVLARSRESLNSNSDSRSNLLNLPQYSPRLNNPGHEKDANRFHYVKPDHTELRSGNQFIHRANRNSDHSKEEAERPERPPSSDQLSSEVDNLVIMRGWVKSLISKFQDNKT